MADMFYRVLVTGGAGFIGSHFVRTILQSQTETRVRVLDKLTYAGNLENLRDCSESLRYEFVKGDICDREAVDEAMRDVDAIVNFAAETHVDRSISDPESFLNTDIFGTHVLLEAARSAVADLTRAVPFKRYLQISTDEVYGSIDEGAFTEASTLAPNSPYSASKAGGDHLVRSYFVTYGLPVVITRSSNNYGPYQYPEKLMPLFITNACDDVPVPLYGDGLNVRDWLYVVDNCRGIWTALEKGEPGEVYNIGGGNERTNVEIAGAILKACGKDESLIRWVKDRPGHDRRYAVDSSRIESLGWRAEVDFEDGLRETVEWYRGRRDWWEPIKSGEFREYYMRQYCETS